MKQIYTNAYYGIKVDTKGKKCGNIEGSTSQIGRLYPIEEPTEFIYNCGERNETHLTDKGDVVLRFYHNEFPVDTVVIRDENLCNMLLEKYKQDQLAKEKWAESKNLNCKDCDESCEKDC